MGRKKIDTSLFLEDRKKRRTAFRKRKDGVLKKLRELSTLCGCEIFLSILDEKHQLQRFAYSAEPHTMVRRVGSHLQQESVVIVSGSSGSEEEMPLPPNSKAMLVEEDGLAVYPIQVVDTSRRSSSSSSCPLMVTVSGSEGEEDEEEEEEEVEDNESQDNGQQKQQQQQAPEVLAAMHGMLSLSTAAAVSPSATSASSLTATLRIGHADFEAPSPATTATAVCGGESF